MYMYIHVLMRDERRKEGRKKQARSNKQQGKAAHVHSTLHVALRKQGKEDEVTHYEEAAHVS